MKIPASILALSLVVSSFSLHAKEMGEPTLSGDEFTQRFIASYGILSEKEPELSDVEITILKKLAPLIRVNKEYAETLLKSLTVGETESSPSFNYLLGNIYFENAEYLLAEEEYKKAIDAFPDFQRAWTNLGVLKLRSGDTRSALIALVKAVELGDTSPQTFGMLGFCHFSQGNYISADVAYDRAVLAEPDNLDWLEGKAQTYLKAERWTEAIRMQDELIGRQPRRAEYWMAQTNAYLGQKDFAKAARNLEIVRSLNAADFQSLFLLGSLYSQLGMFGPASDAYLDAANFAESSDINYLTKAVKLLLHHKQVAVARELFDRIEPDTDNMPIDVAYAYRILEGDFADQAKNFQDALVAYEQAEQIDPMKGEALIKLARVNDALGNRDKAYLLLDRAEDDPDQEYNALVTRVRFLIDEQRFEESQTYVARALKLRSDEAIKTLYDQIEQAAKVTKG